MYRQTRNYSIKCIPQFYQVRSFPSLRLSFSPWILFIFFIEFFKTELRRRTANRERTIKTTFKIWSNWNKIQRIVWQIVQNVGGCTFNLLPYLLKVEINFLVQRFSLGKSWPLTNETIGIPRKWKQWPALTQCFKKNEKRVRSR